MAEMTLAGLKVVREVADRGSFTAAADSLGYTQSAVSRQVAAVEAAAGAPLFRRAPRGVRLTEAGDVLLRHADRILDQVDAARRELAGSGAGAKGRLRVGAFPTAVAALLPRSVAAFRSRHGRTEVSLREGTTPAQLRRVASGSIDLAVVGALPNQPLDHRGVALEPLLEDPLLLAVGRRHPLARRRTVNVDDLAGEPWIAAGTNPADPFLGVWPSLDWRPQIAFVAREWTAKLGLVAAGLGVTVVPGLAVPAIREDVALVRVRARQPGVRAVALATRAGADPSCHARALADELHEAAADLSLEIQRRVLDR
jgi:DNA-binding transcriptional LysR family regulator